MKNMHMNNKMCKTMLESSTNPQDKKFIQNCKLPLKSSVMRSQEQTVKATAESLSSGFCSNPSFEELDFDIFKCLSNNKISPTTNNEESKAVYESPKLHCFSSPEFMHRYNEKYVEELKPSSIKQSELNDSDWINEHLSLQPTSGLPSYDLHDFGHSLNDIFGNVNYQIETSNFNLQQTLNVNEICSLNAQSIKKSNELNNDAWNQHTDEFLNPINGSEYLNDLHLIGNPSFEQATTQNISLKNEEFINITSNYPNNPIDDKNAKPIFNDLSGYINGMNIQNLANYLPNSNMILRAINTGQIQLIPIDPTQFQQNMMNGMPQHTQSTSMNYAQFNNKQNFIQNAYSNQIIYFNSDGKKVQPIINKAEPIDLMENPSNWRRMPNNGGYQCNLCNKSYTRKYGLKIHLRIHSGFKPLECKVCQKKFGDPSNMAKHIRLHSTEGSPYKCTLCEKPLVRRRDLERHMRSRHPDISLKQ